MNVSSSAKRGPVNDLAPFVMENASIEIDGNQILDAISIRIEAGDFVVVLGENGSGKTTLCRAVLGLMAPLKGHLRIFDCACDELRCHHRAKIGYLPQEPQLDETLDVRGNVELAVAAQRRLLTRYEEISHRFAEPMTDDEMTKLIDEQAKVQEQAA